VLRGRRFDAAHPAVMAIVNRTPDSFFSGNRHADLDGAKRTLEEALELGADLVDIGGVRAGQEGDPVDAEEEIRRVVPFLEWARATHPDVVRDVVTTLAGGANRAELSGIPPERILIDPTLDFGKTTAHSLEVLRHTADVAALGYPVLQAISRKDFVGETLDLPAEERLEGSLAATAVAAWLGAVVFRAHDVRATRRVLDMVATIRGDRPPLLARRGTPGPSLEKRP
jgi:dihydropteroate synthase